MRKLFSLGIALLGLFDSLYLLWSYTSPSRPMVCLGTGCDAVRASVYSHLAGVPMPVFGVAGYAALAILIIAESLLPAALARVARYAVAGTAVLGFLFSLYLEYLQGFVIHAYCAWCVVSGMAMTALAVLAVYDLARPAPEPDTAVQLAQVRQRFALCVVALLIGVPGFYALAQHGELPPPPPTASPEVLKERLVRPDSHAAGNLAAPLTVVEFGDFECPVCAQAEEAARIIRSRYGNQIRFVFRQFPLARIHPYAESAAEASECAAEQGKFWAAVDKIYSRQYALSDEGLKQDAAELGLDQARFKQCLASGSAAARVRQDLADGQALGVNATPTFFVGQKRLVGALPVAAFSQAIDQELASLGVSATAAVTPPATSPAPRTDADPVRQAKKSKAAVTGAGTSQPASSSSSGAGLLGGTPGDFFSGFQGGTPPCSEAEADKKQPTLIGTPELRQILASTPPPVFVDVRPPRDYAAGKIPGALNLPAGEVAQRWSSLPHDRVIVLYESGRSAGDICAASRAAGRTLLEHGLPFDHIKVYQDGLAGWEKSGLNAKNQPD